MKREIWEELKSLTPAPPGLTAVYVMRDDWELYRTPILYVGMIERLFHYDDDATGKRPLESRSLKTVITVASDQRPPESFVRALRSVGIQ